MDLNIWNNQKINIDWKLCFICQQQGKDNPPQHHMESSNYHRICSGFGC